MSIPINISVYPIFPRATPNVSSEFWLKTPRTLDTRFFAYYTDCRLGGHREYRLSRDQLRAGVRHHVWRWWKQRRRSTQWDHFKPGCLLLRRHCCETKYYHAYLTVFFEYLRVVKRTSDLHVFPYTIFMEEVRAPLFPHKIILKVFAMLFRRLGLLFGYYCKC